MGIEEATKILLGLEIHITVKSQKKIFNWEKTYEGNICPNSQVGPWELGYLGVLPIINPEVIKLGLKLASALEMKVSKLILFDRKIYNYFDLPKGYQITQQELPLATNGFLPLIKDNKIETIPIKTLQLEEDTAKSIYDENEAIKLDFNRAGNPLIELVTEPVFHQVETVLIFIKQLQNLLRYLEISEAKMEQGQLRVDLNFSLQLGNKYATPRYEVKNLNSLANIEKALKHEINKHHILCSQGQKPPISQTLGFDEKKQITIARREKTKYFYLPEVNVPPIKLKGEEIKRVKKNIPKLPWHYWEDLKDAGSETAGKILNNPSLLKIASFLEKKKPLAKEEYKRWLIFYLNYLTLYFRDGNVDLFSKKWKSYYKLFQYWQEKKLGNEEIKAIIKELVETKKPFASLVKKYEKEIDVNENLIEKELKNLWSNALAAMIIANRQKVQNYLLGQMRKKFPDYPVREVILIITNFLKEKI